MFVYTNDTVVGNPTLSGWRSSQGLNFSKRKESRNQKIQRRLLLKLNSKLGQTVNHQKIKR